MAMRIMHDASAALAVTELNKNANNLQKDLKKVASGMRINSAADDASGYAIGERMAVRLRALNQDIINTQTGSDLIRVAEGGVQSVIEELRTLKELALNSINDHNSELDRATLQKEFEHRTANIDNIANETEYNGRILLNGDYRRKFLGASTIPAGRNVLSTNTVSSTATSAPVTSSSTKTSVQTSKPVTKTTRSTTTTTSDTMPTTGTTEGTPTSTTTTSNSTSVVGPTPSVTSNTVTTDVQTTDNGDGTFTEVKTDVTTRATTNTTVTTDTETTTTVTTKVSTIVSATPVSSGSTGAAENLEFDPNTEITINTQMGLFPTATYPRVDTSFVEKENGTYKAGYSPLRYMKFDDFQGYTRGVYPCIIFSKGMGEGAGQPPYYKFFIYAEETSQTPLTDIPPIGTKVWLKGGITQTLNGGVTGLHSVGQVRIEENPQQPGVPIIYPYKTAEGEIRDTQAGHEIGGYYTAEKLDFSGFSGIIPDGLNNQGFTIECADCPQFVSIKFDSERNVGEGIKTVGQQAGASSATGYYDRTAYTAYSYVVGIKGVTTADELEEALFQGLADAGEIAPGGGIKLDTREDHNLRIKYIDGDYYLLKNGYPMVLQEGFRGTITGGNTTATGNTTPATSYEVTTETITTTTTTITTKETKTTEYETITDTITDTTTTVYEPTEEIIERYNTPLIIHTGTKANQHLRVYIEDMRPEALGIDKAKVDPQEAAIESLAIIDGAIDYAIEQATHLGAYISRLGHTENTLTADSENTQASESTIRDADMALEMLHYTKDNILAQTAQAMLAQANQNASNVLSLLQ